jgi:hypothetical protein
MTRVEGVVREGRRPVARGWIEFFPVDGTIGKLRSARLRSDGSFEAEQVAVGVNLIRLVNAPFESPGAVGLFDQYSSPIRRRIPERSGQPLAIDLVEEMIQFLKARSRDTGPESIATERRR